MRDREPAQRVNAVAPAWKQRGFSIEAMRDLARAALPRPVFDYADGGAEDERALRRNETAFGEIELLPRPLNGAAERDLSVTLFGQKLKMPLIVGPTGLSGLFWPDGESCAARAATAAGIPYCLSHASVCTIEDLAARGPAPRWMQVFIYKDRGFTRELAERAQAAGYGALVLTTDNQLLGHRERDLRNGFTIPPSFGPAGLAGMALKAEWLWRMRKELSRVTFGNYVRPGENPDMKTLAARMGALLDPAMAWSDVDELRRVWTGPLILKGVLHPAEARAALDHGVDGLVVSNHGGRQVDAAPATIDALPAVAEAVAGRMPVLLDGGVRRGADVVKALALGATACLLGRPTLWGLATAGEAGVAHVLDIYRREIDRVMGLCGLARIADITGDVVFPRVNTATRIR